MTVMRVTVTKPDYTLSFTLNEAAKTFTGYEDVDTFDHVHFIDFKGSYTQDGDTG